MYTLWPYGGKEEARYSGRSSAVRTKWNGMLLWILFSALQINKALKMLWSASFLRVALPRRVLNYNEMMEMDPT